MPESATLLNGGAIGARVPSWRGPVLRHGLALVLVGAVASLALLVMLSWSLPWEFVSQWRFGVVPSQFTTAAALFLLALGIALANSRGCWPARLAATLAATLALAALVEYVGHVDLGTRGWLAFRELIDNSPRSGRMALSSALAILFCAAGTWGLTLPARWSWARPMIFACAGAMVFLVLGALWRGSHVEPSIWFPAMTEIAPQTVLLALGLALALFLRAPPLGKSGASVLQNVGAWTIVSMVILSFLMWQALERSSWQQQSDDTAAAASRIADDIESLMEHRGHALMRLAHDWEIYGAPDGNQWERAATSLLRDDRSLNAVSFTDAQGAVRWRVASDSASPVGARLFDDERRFIAYLRATQTHAVQLFTVLHTDPFASTMTYFAPAFQGDELQGFVVSSIQSDQLQAMVDPRLSEKFSFIVRDGDQAIVRIADEPRISDTASHRVPLGVLGQAWSVEAWPRLTYMAHTRDALPLVALLFGCSAAAFMTAAFCFARRTGLSRLAAQRLGERLTDTLENVGDAFVLIDRRGRFQFVNGQAESLFGISRDKLIGRDVLQALPGVVGGVFEQRLSDALLNHEAVQFVEFSAVYDRWVDVRAYPTHEGLSVYFRDISQERRLQEQVRQSQQLESVGQLSGGVAHDFNNLLTVILGNAEMLVEELSHDAELEPLAKMIFESAKRGADLTQRMLAFARRQPLAPQVVDVCMLIAGFEAMVRRMLSEDIDIAIVRDHKPCLAMVDPVQLESALLNLCVNARDAMPDGGKLTLETTQVELDAAYAQQHLDVQAGDYVLVAVTDTGCGIPPETLARVFEPFFTTKEQGRGTGLGLAMVYGLVKQSGGHVTIYSEPDQGTTIRLYLPCAQGQVHEYTPTQPGTLEAMHADKRETVLVVEDDVQVRRFATNQLGRLGYNVLEAGDGAQALDIVLQRDDIDLLFTDVVMPGTMNGRQLADAARQYRPGLRVLFTSGYTANAIVHQGRLDPDVLFLPKPYRRTALAARIRAALDTHP